MKAVCDQVEAFDSFFSNSHYPSIYLCPESGVFGIDPILLKAGQVELAAIGLYVKDKEREKTLIGAPRLKWGITSNWEFNLTVPLVNQKRTLSLAREPCSFSQCGKCTEELVIKGVGDVITSLKWQSYRYFDKDEGEAPLLTLLGGLAIPGNLPEAGAGPLVVEDELITTGTDVGCPKTSLLFGASTLFVGASWGILASLLIGIERENECGNRAGHFFSYSYGVGRKFGDYKFMDIYGLLEFDWIYESSARRNGKRVPCTSNHIFWFGPNLIIEQDTREFKFSLAIFNEMEIIFSGKLSKKYRVLFATTEVPGYIATFLIIVCPTR